MWQGALMVATVLSIEGCRESFQGLREILSKNRFIAAAKRGQSRARRIGGPHFVVDTCERAVSCKRFQ